LNPPRERSEVAEEDERLVELRLTGVGALPSGAGRRVCAEHVVISQDMIEAHLLDGQSIVADHCWVHAPLGLGEDCADTHVLCSSLSHTVSLRVTLSPLKGQAAARGCCKVADLRRDPALSPAPSRWWTVRRPRQCQCART